MPLCITKTEDKIHKPLNTFVLPSGNSEHSPIRTGVVSLHAELFLNGKYVKSSDEEEFATKRTESTTPAAQEASNTLSINSKSALFVFITITSLKLYRPSVLYLNIVSFLHIYLLLTINIILEILKVGSLWISEPTMFCDGVLIIA